MRAARVLLRPDGLRLDRERLLLCLLPLLVVAQVVAAGAGIVNDAYSYEDNFDDNNGIDAAASANYQNLGGLIEATGSTMTVQSPCFSLPQPSGGSFNGWLFMDVAVAQLSNTSSNTLVVDTKNGAVGLPATGNLKAGDQTVPLTLDFSGIEGGINLTFSF